MGEGVRMKTQATSFIIQTASKFKFSPKYTFIIPSLTSPSVRICNADVLSISICNADVLSISICNALTSINPIESE